MRTNVDHFSTVKVVYLVDFHHVLMLSGPKLNCLAVGHTPAEDGSFKTMLMQLHLLNLKWLV